MRASLVFLLGFSALRMLGQSDIHACEAPPEVRNIYDVNKGSPKRVEILRAKIEANLEEIWFHRWYLGSPGLKPGSLSAEYKAKVDAHPDSAEFLYLYGLSLMGFDTPKAIEYFHLAAEKDPEMPATYDSLTDIYASQVFGDPAKLADNMRRLNDLCPKDLSAFRHLATVRDKAASRELVARFRKSVEGRGTSGVAGYYPQLWEAEFRIADPKDFGTLREQVARDMARAKKLNPDDTLAAAEGYKLINDPVAAKKVEIAAEPRTRTPTFNDAFNGWTAKNQWPKPDSSPEESERFNRSLVAASEQWARDFPDDTNALYWRMTALSWAKNPDKEAVEKAGEGVLACDAKHKPAWTQNPYCLSVAATWNSLDIRLPDCLRLAAQGLAELDAPSFSDNDMRRAPTPPSGPAWDWNVSLKRFEGWSVEGDASRKLGEYAKTRSVIEEMKAWIDKNHPDNPRLEYERLKQCARLAEAEGRKLDALAYYQKAIFAVEYAKDEKEKARILWAELGGSADEFAVWLNHATPKPVAPQFNVTGWSKTDEPINLNAPDLNGKTWTVADIRGKKTFINVWATWCGPCREELPNLQKLYERTKGRKDVRVVTFNMDSNLGLVGPFMDQNKYTFPVIFASDMAEKIHPEAGIPKNWIADEEGTLRLEKVGYEAKNWLADALERLNSELK